MATHNGGVDFTAPPNLSAMVDVSTHNGSIKTNLPITVVGKIGRRKLTGKIGTGEGKLHLETHNIAGFSFVFVDCHSWRLHRSGRLLAKQVQKDGAVIRANDGP
jgi:hypothetical protein